MSEVSPQEQLLFLSNVQRLLGEGQFTATYKFALLTALADICVEKGSDDCKVFPVQTGRIAEKFIQSYWPQARPYPVAGRAPTLLLQNIDPRKPPAVVGALQRFQEAGKTLVELRREDRLWNGLVSKVRGTICKMPLGKLQLIGRQRLSFLYDDASLQSGRVVEQIELRPGVMFCFRKYHALLTDLIRGAWIRYVRRYNAGLLGSPTDLDQFLFGSERAPLATYLPILRELQDAKCFYCDRKIDKGKAQVDHFVPWSRYPVDLGHNFVLAHSGCNLAKADYLAATLHLSRWMERNRNNSDFLAERFRAANIFHDLNNSVRIAMWAYSQAFIAGAATWISGQRLEPLRPDWLPILN